MKPLSYNPPVRPLLRKNILATAILLSLSALSPAVNSADRQPIGDLEIYQSLLPGTPKLMLMIDVSANLRRSSVIADYGANCDNENQNSYNVINSETVTATVGGQTITSFDPWGCQAAGGKTSNQDDKKGNAKEWDRLSRLQLTLTKLLADTVSIGNGNNSIVQSKALLPNGYAIGIGIFGYESTGQKAKILSSVGNLTAEKRIELIQTIGNLRTDQSKNNTSDTPSAVGVSIGSALAESGAYMMGTSPIDTTAPLLASTYSGFNESTAGVKEEDGSSYIAPEIGQCSGKGIFILTDDGVKIPQNTSNDIQSLFNVQMMNKSLNEPVEDPDLLNQCTADFDGAWKCTGAYARALRNPNNPSEHSIKTATAGIGQAFNVFSSTTQEITVNGKKLTVPNCAAGTSKNAQNLCKLGELKADATAAYGNGKFYPIPTTAGDTDSAITISKSIADFASGLSGIGNAGPAGTITVPDNPYQVSERLPFAYLPMLRPDISSTNSVWSGNLKKYQLNNGTLYGKSNSALYTNTAGNLSDSTKDLWQDATATVADSSAIDVGGVYAKLTTPQSGLGSVRTVYVEDVTSIENSTPVLRKLSVDTDGKLVGFDALIDPVYTETLYEYGEQNKRRILSFLGFKQYTTATTDGSTTTKQLLDINGNLPSNFVALNANTVMVKPTEAIRVLGGVVHSKPAAISYSATLDANGTITSPREDYALFGSMDGALHLVNAADDSGVEQFAVIPKEMIASQSIALVKDSKNGAVGQPYFGVDAPWLVTTDYTYDMPTAESTTGKVKVDTSTGSGVFAYGGLRMGGEAFYGMDVTDKSDPKILFTITPEKTFTDLTDPTTPVTTTTGTAGFERLGQIWSKPTAAKIRVSKDADPIDVLLFGGGYDMQYESDSYVATSTAPAKGNSIYMINAQTGELLWSTSAEATSGKNTNTASMIHSITGGITVLDRDNDGLMDHLYAADLGGQVFRADFENARPEEFGLVDRFSNKRVVRILNTTETTETTADPVPYRFYERPVVSFYRNESTSNIFALVNVISGNRSAPLSKLRDGEGDDNRVYGIIDTDVTSASLNAKGFTATITNLTESNLLNLSNAIDVSTATTAEALETKKTAARDTLVGGEKNGWYYPLTRFDGYENVKYNKGIGDSVVINSLLYTTVYNPDKMYTAPQSCTTSILGGSERQVYCLPYGICSDANSANGTGGFVPAGQGIQELTLGAFNDTNTNVKVLIGTRTITDRILENNRIAYGAGDTTSKYYNVNSTNQDKLDAFSNLGDKVGGDGSAVEYLFNERYTLQPKEWYEKK